MSTGYDIDAINRMLGLDSDADATTAVLSDPDDYQITQAENAPWLPDDQAIRLTASQHIADRAAVTISQPAVPVKFTQVTQPGRKTNLMNANREWARRPQDERFWTIQEMAAACAEHKRNSREVRADMSQVQVVSQDGDLVAVGAGLERPAKFTNYSFGQLCGLAGAPAGYLQGLDSDLAAQCLNAGLKRRAEDVRTQGSNLLVRNAGAGNQSVGAFLSSGYSRIWNADVVGRLGVLEDQGWRVPPARPVDGQQLDPRARRATEADVLTNNKGGGGLSINVGDWIAPAGLYASDRDCFAFMVNEGIRIDAGGGEGLNRGFFMWNSEVGDRSFGLMTFLYDATCGNHICWVCSNVQEIRIVHRGRANTRWLGDLQRSLISYAGQSAEKDRRIIVAAMNTQIGDNRDRVIEKLFEKRIAAKKTLEAAYNWSIREAVLRGHSFNPTSVWGMVCGLTRVSQECGWADERVKLDMAAGKLMAMAS